MQAFVRREKGKNRHGSVRGIIGLTLLFVLILLLTVGCGGAQEAQPPEETEKELTQETMKEPETPEETEGEGVDSEERLLTEATEEQVQENGESQSDPTASEETEGASDQGAAPQETGQPASSPQETEPGEKPATEDRGSQTAPDMALEPGGLLITGTGLAKDLALNPSQWQLNSPDFVQRLYSSNNNLGFHKVWRVKGYDLLSLFRQAGMVEGKDHTITFVSADGLSISFPLSDLQNRFFFSDLTPTSSVKAMPVIGFYRKELFDAIEPQPPVSWQEEALSDGDADPQWPRLYLGQQPNNPSDVNQPFFIRELVRIVVGEER